MKFSPTTLIGYARLIASLIVVGRPLYHYVTIQNWDAASETITATAALTLVNGVLSAVAGHFTADAPPGPKADE